MITKTSDVGRDDKRSLTDSAETSSRTETNESRPVRWEPVLTEAEKAFVRMEEAYWDSRANT